ncbi:MAG: hypothetical protein IPN86_19055 [Saprospiraceae bacterium]|nr:hypothetical protein [Saprospiraceae bacterium]
MKLRIFLILVGAYLGACSPKVIDVKQDTIVKTDSLPVRQEPKSPCTSFADLSGSDKERAETAFVLYKDYVKAGNIEEALKHWKVAYSIAPGSNGRVKYHFEDGANIYKKMYENTLDPSLRRSYVDTIMMIYDKKKECFGDEAYINGIKGFDYFYYYPEYTTPEQTFNLLKSNFDVKGKNADYFVVNPFTKLLYDRVTEGKLSNEDGRRYAELILNTIANGKATCKGKSCESWEIIDEYAPSRLEALEGVDDFYGCQYYANKYHALYQLYPDSCEIINLAYARMLRGNCTSDEPRLAELKQAKAVKCYVAPPALSCAAQGNEDYNNGKYKKAIESYLNCVQNSNDNEQKAKYLLLVAKIYYRDVKNYPQSRKYALEAARLKSGWGEPFLLIGNLYASSGPLCGTGRGWESQIVTWPAIDMWTKAKNLDVKVTSEANALINRYLQYMPKKEDIFFRNLKAGQSYFIPCWIQESTTIRTSD